MYRCPCGANKPIAAPSFAGNDVFVNLVLLLHGNINSTLVILCGMVKDVVVLSNHVVGFPVFLDFRIYYVPCTESIEMRLCCTGITNSEDVPFSTVELYIK